MIDSVGTGTGVLVGWSVAVGIGAVEGITVSDGVVEVVAVL